MLSIAQSSKMGNYNKSNKGREEGRKKISKNKFPSLPDLKELSLVI